MKLIETSTITCPHCGHRSAERMPKDACRIVYECKGCGQMLEPLPGHCCVFCSYGSAPCPPVQIRQRAGRAESARDRQSAIIGFRPHGGMLARHR